MGAVVTDRLVGPSWSLPTSHPSQTSPWALKLLRASRSSSRFWDSSESDEGRRTGVRCDACRPRGPHSSGTPPPTLISYPDFPFSSVWLGFSPCSATSVQLVSGEGLSGKQGPQGHPHVPHQPPWSLSLGLWGHLLILEFTGGLEHCFHLFTQVPSSPSPRPPAEVTHPVISGPSGHLCVFPSPWKPERLRWVGEAEMWPQECSRQVLEASPLPTAPTAGASLTHLVVNFGGKGTRESDSKNRMNSCTLPPPRSKYKSGRPLWKAHWTPGMSSVLLKS